MNFGVGAARSAAPTPKFIPGFSNALVGKPIIKRTRLSVEFVIDFLAQGWSTDEILRNYPGITLADILACLHYASAILKAEKVYAISG